MNVLSLKLVMLIFCILGMDEDNKTNTNISRNRSEAVTRVVQKSSLCTTLQVTPGTGNVKLTSEIID